ncbi:MAG: LEPR-XLL domain-containing protein, partial [Phycisphaerales bacterium]|nr:LEPR-XLL domain-containing protein [Phycisphaerales bacterium]
MSKWDLRRSVSNLHRSAGRASQSTGAFEALETRVFLSGDPFPSATFLNIDELTGWAAGADSIENVADTPFFKFTALRDDFISVLADTQNIDGGSDLNTALEIYDCDGNLMQSSLDNDELSSGLANDAWVGFIGQEGEDYYARVISEDGSIGEFRLYVRGLSDDSTVQLITTPPLQ